MKDKEIRERIESLEKDLHDRIKILERTGLTVKDCPKCKHPVLAQAKWAQASGQPPRIGNLHQCLTCGSKFTFKEVEQLVVEE